MCIINRLPTSVWINIQLKRFSIFQFFEKLFQSAVKECLILTQGRERKSWNILPNLFVRYCYKKHQRKTSPLLHWINIPQNWSAAGLFLEMFYFFHSEPSSGARGASWNDFRGVLGRWTISGTVNCPAGPGHPSMGRPDFRCGRGETTISNVKQKSTFRKGFLVPR